MIKTTALALVVLFAGTSLASAQSGRANISTPFGGGTVEGATKGPTIGGKFDSKVQAKDVTAKAKGDNAIARNSIGSATDGTAGEFHSDVDVGNVGAEAEGSGACAENQIGSMGSSACIK